MLCSTCTICFISGDLESKLKSRMHAPLPHHETFDTFLSSVEESCTVCSAVWRSTEGRGRSMRREQNPQTQFSLEARRNAAGRSALSKSTRVITIYWQERGERFQQQKAFSLELVKGTSDCLHIFRTSPFELTYVSDQRRRLLGKLLKCNYATQCGQQQSQPS